MRERERRKNHLIASHHNAPIGGRRRLFDMHKALLYDSSLMHCRDGSEREKERCKKECEINRLDSTSKHEDTLSRMMLLLEPKIIINFLFERKIRQIIALCE